MENSPVAPDHVSLRGDMPVAEEQEKCDTSPVNMIETPVVKVETREVEETPVEKVETRQDHVFMKALVTAYCPCEKCCGRNARGLTCLRQSAWCPGVAVDPRAIPYGTRLVVPGYNDGRPVVADDTGGAMRRDWRLKKRLHIDVRVTYHWQAQQFGRQTITIKVLR